MKKKETLLALLLALLLSVSAGCSPSDPGAENTDKGGAPASVEPTQEPTPAQDEPEESLDPEMVDKVKYNIYVELNNKIVDVLDTMYSYYEVVEYADEFALRSDSEYTYKYDISPYNTDLLEDASYVASLEPAFETLDNLIPLAPDKREGYVDDGVTTILCLGNDPFSLERGENGLAEQIAKKTGATVYNGSFTGTTMAAQFASYNDGYILDAFSFSYVAKSIASGDFDLMKTAATYSYDESFAKTAQMLSELDMNTVDMICVMYDGSDYVNKRPCDDPNAPYAEITYTGALRAGVKAIQEAYPHIRIVVMSHTFCHSIGEDGNFQNGDRADLGHGTLSHYLQKERDATMDVSVSFIDNFYGSINEDNYLDYMTDYIHFNDAGREVLAQRFADCLFPSSKSDSKDVAP